MAWRKINDTKLTAIADAIRGKTGKTDALTLDAMPTEIVGIETGVDTEVIATTNEDGTQNIYITSKLN